VTNFTLADVCKTLAGLVLFIPFAFSPGYVIGWLSDVLEFRKRSLGEKSLMALVLSIATVPLLIYLTARFGSMTLAWILTAAAFGTSVVLFVRDLRKEEHPLAGWRGSLLLALCWTVIGLASMVDFHWKDRLYIAASTFDYAVRNQIIESINRTGIRPWNPFFFPGHPVALRYHYFWFLPCSMVSTLGRGWVGPSHAIMAGTIWCGFALMALVPIYTWNFRTTDGPPSRRRAWAGVALLWVIGLDIIPWLVFMSAGVWLFIIDKWNEEIDGWLVSLLWAPHYVAGMIACLTGFLVLWRSTRHGRAAQLGVTVVAGIAFACSTGTAIYIALVFAAALGAFGMVSVWKRWWNDALGIALSGAIAAGLAAPYLSGLIAAGGTEEGPGRAFILPTVRLFTLPDAILASLHVSWNSIAVVNLFLLPLNYLLELGLLFVVGIVQAGRYANRRAPLGRKEWAEIVLIAMPVLVCTFFRSSVIQNNDLGWRGFLIPQFILLLWSIDYVRFAVRKIRRTQAPSVALLRLRRRVLITSLVGVAGTVSAFAINRAFMPAYDFGWNHQKSWLYPDQVLGKRVLAMRETYEWLDRNADPRAVVMRSPEYPDLSYGLFSKRQTVASDAACGTDFGGSLDVCRNVLAVVLPLFMGQPAGSAPETKSLCERYSISLIIVKDLDPVWRDPGSWIWKRRPVYSNHFSKVFACED
jgi:hypothetical protein